MTPTQNQLLTHTLEEDWKSNFIEIKDRLTRQGDLPDLSLEESIDLLNQLSRFELGRSLIKNRGLNGYWTNYIVLFPHLKQQALTTSLEKWLLTRCPIVQATQERFDIFRKVIQEKIFSHSIIASIPCGLLDVLLRLDYSQTPDVKLVGIDYDSSALQFAQKNSKNFGLEKKCSFLQKDAWNLSVHENYDLIVSNGLNFYEPDDKRVILLYKEFYKALKPKGYLVISFLTPPPTVNPSSSWKNINAEDALKQKKILSDILQIKFQVYRTEDQMRSHLDEAGFTTLNVIYDKQGMMPTILAQKR